MDNFIFKGKSSTEFKGIVINYLPPIVKPPKRVNKIQIDGRDGDIIEELGYEPYDKEIGITILEKTDVDELIEWLDGKGILILSNEPDKYYQAEIINQIDFSKFEKYEKIKIKFHCQPFKRLYNEPILLKDDFKKSTTSNYIEDANGTVENLKLCGNTYQETRSGKNLCNGVNQGFYINNDATKSGITNTDSGLILATNNINTYTISSINVQNRYRVACTNTIPTDDASIDVFNGVNKDGTSDIITINTMNYKYLILNATDLSKIQIEQGSTATDYEEFGASPSPDFPSSIKTVGVKSFIKDSAIHTQNNSLYYLGKNYWYSNNDLSECIELEANTTYTFSCSEYTSDNKLTLMDSSKAALIRPTLTGFYTFTTTQKCWLHYYSNGNTEQPKWQLINCGTQVENLSYGNWLLSKITGKNLLKLDDRLIAGYTTTAQGIKYTFNQNGSISIKGTTGTSLSSIVLLGKNLNNYTTKRWHEDRDVVVNFSVEGLSLNCRQTTGLYSALNSAKGKDVGVIYLQVNPNTTIDTTIYPLVTYKTDSNFEVYKENIVKLNLNKESLIDGNFKQGNNTSDKNDMTRLFTTQNYKLKSNQTYIFSTDMDITKYKYAIITNTAEFPTSTSTNVYNSGWLTTSRHTFASTSNACFGILIGKIDGSNLTPDDIKDYKFILYEGTDPFPYHELKKIDDVSDEVNMVTGILTKRIGKVVLDGSESGWITHNTTSVRNSYKISIQDLYSYTDGYVQPLIMCSHFKPISQQDTWLPGTCSLRAPTKEMIFNVDTTQTLEQFKTWLSSNPVTVYYVLETPETIQLSKNNIKLFESENNINLISDLKSSVNLKYFSNEVLNIINTGNCVSKPRITIYGKNTIKVILNEIQVFNIELGNEEYITIDVDKMEAFKDNVLKNRLCTGNYDDFIFKKGKNTLKFDGAVDKVEINNYSRFI